MASLNKTRPSVPAPKTHGGATAVRITPLQELRRTVLSCMLWENEFYEDGTSIADRIAQCAAKVSPHDVAKLAIEARTEHNLRHVSLLLLLDLIRRGGPIVQDTIVSVIQRADELTELVALYWRNGKRPLSAQMKKGLARAFTKFDAYQLAKYDRDNKMVRLRDVLFLTHAKPRDEAQAAVWKQLVDGTLPSPDTWEVALSTGGDKCAEFTRLLREKKLGYFALLRNLRNMVDAGVDLDLIRSALLARESGADKILPFRYVAAARACPRLEPEIDQSLLSALSQAPKLPGKTVLIVDVSGSMNSPLSGKSGMTRLDAACAVAAIIRGTCQSAQIYATAGCDSARTHATALVPPRQGMALIDATKDMRKQIGGGGIFLTQVMAYIKPIEKTADRVIVITDEQDCSARPEDSPRNAEVWGTRNYMINVASYKNGIGYGKWTHIDGFSEAVIKFIYALEANNMDLT